MLFYLESVLEEGPLRQSGDPGQPGGHLGKKIGGVGGGERAGLVEVVQVSLTLSLCLPKIRTALGGWQGCGVPWGEVGQKERLHFVLKDFWSINQYFY